MTTFDDAIEAASNNVRAVVTFSGSLAGWAAAQLVTDVSINRQVTDLPDSATEVFGSASAQASITLAAQAPDGTKALDVSPYSTATASTGSLSDYALGAGVTIAERVTDASGATQDYTLFTGVVTGFAPQTDGTVTLSCQDYADKMHVPVTLPGAGAASASKAFDAVVIVDLAMRAAGLYVSPSLRSGAILSVPGIGGDLPEVGSYVASGHVSLQTLPSGWSVGNSVIGGAWTMGCSASVVRTGKWTTVEGWFQPSTLAGNPVLVSMCSEASSPILITVLSTGAVQVSGGGPSTATTATLYFPNDAAWHYVLVKLPPPGSASSATVTVDTASPQTLSWPAGAGYNADILSATRVNVCPSGWNNVGVQVWNDGGSATSNASWVSTASPPSTQDLTPITAISQQSVQDSWSLLQDLAKAVGAVCYFNESGAMQYVPRANWRAKRFNASVRTVNQSRLTTINYHWSTASIAQLVTANVNSWQVTSTLGTTPVWSATDTYTCPAGSTQTYDITIDGQVLFGLQPTTNGFDTGNSNSWFRACAASSVGDPAADPIGGVTVILAPTGTGLTLTIGNPHSYDIALWTGGNGGSIQPGPYLVVYGLDAAAQPVKGITSSARPSGSIVALEDSQWRQDVTYSQAMIDDISHDLAMPVVVFDQVTVPIDPRRTLGDVITLQDTRSMTTGQPVQIVGIVNSMPANGMHTSDLTVRACYPPTGWILGVAGRSELGTTTTLVI